MWEPWLRPRGQCWWWWGMLRSLTLVTMTSIICIQSWKYSMRKRLKKTNSRPDQEDRQKKQNQTDWPTDYRQKIDSKTSRQTDGRTDIQTDRQTDRQTARKMGKETDRRKGRNGMLGANATKRVAAGAHLPTPWFFESAKRPDDRADCCLDCSFLP